MKYDIVLSGGSVVDGSGRDAYEADVAVNGAVVVAIGKLELEADQPVIDCSGMVVCPGFIDIHGHSELEALSDGTMHGKVGQGITTEVAGNCGVGIFPCGSSSSDIHKLQELSVDVLGSYAGKWDWKTFSGFRKKLEKQGIGTNMLFLQAHCPLRCAAMEGSPNREATDEEIDRMVALLEQSFDQGCIGLSSGLFYAPMVFASKKELVALLQATARAGKLFCVHHRCEGDDVLQSLGEVLDLAKQTGVRLEISHLKAIGSKNQDKVPLMLQMIEAYRQEGVDVLFDQYPYDYGSTSLFSLLPPRYLRLSRKELSAVLRDEAERLCIKEEMSHPKGWDSIYELCGWKDVSVVALDSSSEYDGMDFISIGQKRGQDPFDAFFDLLAQEQGTALMVDVTQSQASLEMILLHPLGCFGTDAIYSSKRCHPRSWAAAVHMLSTYWRERGVMPLEAMIRRMTAEPARRLGLADRGVLDAGYKADIVVFDPHCIRDTATVLDPCSQNVGLMLVMVNGQVVFEKGSFTDKLAGKVLR